jgi:hypothetical protein
MSLIHVTAWLSIFFGGLFSGAILIVAVERVNLWQRMPVDQYVVDFRRALYRLDPLIPIMGVLSGVSAVVFAFTAVGHSAVFAWIGVALIAVIMIASISLAEPMNSKFRRLPEGQAPDGTEQIRIAWRRFHWARTVVALAALASLAAAVT